MIPEDDVRSLALLYHLNSEPRLRIRTSSGIPSEAETFRANICRRVAALPPVCECKFTTMLGKRRSCRAFREKDVAPEVLASVLHFSYGILGTRLERGTLAQSRRPVPSAGALYPFDLYVLAHRVAGIHEGLYIYRPACHSLEEADHVSSNDVHSILAEAADVSAAGVILLLVADLVATLKCYGPRGYRYLLLEAGHIAQNISLSAMAHGLGSLCIGGFKDAELTAHLHLDPHAAGVLYCVAVGFDEADS
jgi:SagB-type dehydrogenase family enzyme